jgi:hypothetical protein
LSLIQDSNLIETKRQTVYLLSLKIGPYVFLTLFFFLVYIFFSLNIHKYMVLEVEAGAFLCGLEK